jgi:hypothetical protein
LGLDSQRVKELASKLHVHSVNFAAILVHTRPFPVLLSTLSRGRFQAKPATHPPDPHIVFLSFPRWRSFTVLGTKVACHAQSLAATNRVTKQLNWLAV